MKYGVTMNCEAIRDCVREAAWKIDGDMPFVGTFAACDFHKRQIMRVSEGLAVFRPIAPEDETILLERVE